MAVSQSINCIHLCLWYITGHQCWTKTDDCGSLLRLYKSHFIFKMATYVQANITFTTKKVVNCGLHSNKLPWKKKSLYVSVFITTQPGVKCDGEKCIDVVLIYTNIWGISTDCKHTYSVLTERRCAAGKLHGTAHDWQCVFVLHLCIPSFLRSATMVRCLYLTTVFSRLVWNDPLRHVQ